MAGRAVNDPVRIAMWSGPRNISTAMMRSFGARPDSFVTDEPFYAAYLDATNLDHPMRDDIIADGEQDPHKVADWLTGPVPGGKSVFYQKHMTHHMIPSVPREWMGKVSHAFLIREPERVLASYVAKRERVELADIGFVVQAELFDMVADMLGEAPPVIAAHDVRENPESILKQLCERLGVTFLPDMLSWKPGIHATDGIWAKHWYHQVERSTGFAPPAEKDAGLPVLPAHLQHIADEARPHYERLARHSLRP
ncbi:hypothetical protein ACKTEK_11845 [Tepidamorphus sp. 3E244]|uniref:sulfotransferase-like domain-containing protein n=1 Tax=Tepidamorphus sp. 3E244 TaxID=3385498 RepID=UPI0038FC6C98